MNNVVQISINQTLYQAIYKAGQTLKNKFNSKDFLPDYTNKTDFSDYLTQADLDSEKILIDNLAKNFPELEIFSEEDSGDLMIDIASKPNIAIIDPLDGTSNFCSGIPYFSISVYLKMETKGEFAIIFNPVSEQTVSNETLIEKFERNNQQEKFCDKLPISRLSFAIVSNYKAPTTIVLPLVSILYEKKCRRVFTNWAPSCDYLNLLQGKIDCVITFSQELYSQQAAFYLLRSHPYFKETTIIIPKCKYHSQPVAVKVFAKKNNFAKIIRHIKKCLRELHD